MTGRKTPKKPRPAKRSAPRSPFQIELIRLIDAHQSELGEASGRALSARLGKSSNHLWQILNKGMIPSGAAILDIARVLALTHDETEGLILKAIETKGRTRSRDNFWIQKVGEMVARRDAEIAAALRFLDERGLRTDFSAWRASGHGGRSAVLGDERR
jgi:hypothetical protein